MKHSSSLRAVSPVTPSAVILRASEFPLAEKLPRWRKLLPAALAILVCALAQPAGAVTLTAGSIGGGAGQLNPTGPDSFNLSGTGAGVWFSQWANESASCAYTMATGDVEVVARLVSFSYPANGSEAGLIIRNSLDPHEENRSSTFYSNRDSGAHCLGFAGNGPTVASNSVYFGTGTVYPKGVNPPYWMKLVRVGNNFAAYWSIDGRDWTLISNNSGGAHFGTVPTYAGLFVSSGGSGTPATAAFDHVYVGAPRLKYTTSWVGSTSGGLADGAPSNDIAALWVKDDGTCYASGVFTENAGHSVQAYKDGKVAFALAAVQNGGLNEGTITGNTNHLFLATANRGNKVFQTDFNGTNAVEMPLPGLGKVGGLAASDSRLFVSDLTSNTVRIVDLTTPTPKEVTAAVTAGIINHPGPIAYDGTNFWIVDCGSPFPLTSYVTTQPGYTPAIKCFDPAGALVTPLRQITGITNPTALAKNPTNNQLYICDNGQNQNIPYYTLSGTGNPTYAGAFGQAGGLWPKDAAGNPAGHPGQINDPGYGGDARFYGPTGIGFDSSGNIYVACDGTNGNGTDLRKFDPSGNLVWKQFGLEFVNVGDFDPGSDTIYTPEERFNMNYANTAPGSEWSYTAFTANPFQANDLRNGASTKPASTQVRRLADNNVFLYAIQQWQTTPIAFYRFNNQDGAAGTPGTQGTTAIPWGSLLNTASPLGLKLWIDKNGDGLEPGSPTDTTEHTQVANSRGAFQTYDVDSGGDIWLAITQNGSLSRSTIGRLQCAGTQTIGTAKVPDYSAANYQNYVCPEPIRALYSLKYDKANDVMYCVGQKADGKWALARYDHWLASSASSPDEHTARWVVSLPDKGADVTVLAPPGTGLDWGYLGMALAGDKVFVADIWGPIRVYDATLGNLAITLNPGPEVSATTAWEDIRMGLNATKRGNEYLVLEENDGWWGSILLYRWTPTADTTVPGAPTQFTAMPQGHAIALAWTGPTGTVTSYNIYRGTVSGSLTLYQSNVTAPSYVDTDVTLGTTYYYTVAAVSTVGTGAQSNPASAVPANAQAEFVKYDTPTMGTWKTVYGNEGQNIAGQTASLPGYVSPTPPSMALPANTEVSHFVPDPTTDPRALQMVSGTDRTSAYYHVTAGIEQSWEIDFTDSTTWHQLSIYLWDGIAGSHPAFVNVEILDATTGAVLDSRQPMDYSVGKWLVWNVRGKVKIHLYAGLGYVPVLSGIFFDPVKTPPPAP